MKVFLPKLKRPSIGFPMLFGRKSHLVTFLVANLTFHDVLGQNFDLQ